MALKKVLFFIKYVIITSNKNKRILFIIHKKQGLASCFRLLSPCIIFMVKVDQNKCIGCGLCANLCPDTFQMNLDGKSEVLNSQDSECAKKAVADCPVEAISLN